MIRAYPAQSTVLAGGDLMLHVSTDARRFRVQIFRCGARYREAREASPWLDGYDVAPGRVDEPWNWPAYALRIPASCASGAYVVVCRETEDAPLAADARSGTALFLVRSHASPSRITVNVPLFTYHAYNVADVDVLHGGGEGHCLYSGPKAVTLQRPGGGTGGHTWDERHVDAYDGDSPRQTFAHWDRKALAWLERRGYHVDVCSDLDLHRYAVPDSTRLLLAFGHQEYWTREMRTSVERFAERGGGVAFFSGNTAWFRIRFDPARQTIVRAGKWSDDDPEECFTGTSYRFGGGRWGGERPAAGYTVEDPDHWLFAGTGVVRGTVFGAAQRLVGYEADGCNPAQARRPLASASLQTWNASDGLGEVLGGAASLVAFPFGAGTIVNAGTVDWVRVLASGDGVVERITRNVIDRLSA